MKNPFSIDKSYVIRHKILEVLYNDWENHNHETRIVGSIKIATDTAIPIRDIHTWQQLLLKEGEIVMSENDGQAMISILQPGISAYLDRKYIKEGRTTKLDGVYAWARILIPLGALILSIFNYYSNRSLTSRVKDLETKFEKLKK